VKEICSTIGIKWNTLYNKVLNMKIKLSAYKLKPISMPIKKLEAEIEKKLKHYFPK